MGMHLKLPICLLFLVCVLACGPADPLPEPPVAGHWQLLEGKPIGYFTSSGDYRGFRLRLTGDSAVPYDPFAATTETYRAYAADSTARFPDSLYLTYSLHPDGELHARRYAPGAPGEALRFVRAAPLGLHSLTERHIGQTYRLDLDGRPHLFANYYARSGDTSSMLIANLFELDTANGRRALHHSMGMAVPRRGIRTATSFFNLRGDQKGQRRYDRLLLSATADGGVQLHREEQDDARRVRVSGGVELERYPALVPESADLDALLNRGYLTTELLTTEPDTAGLTFAYPEDFRGITYADLDQLDFEFRADGTCSTFVGDRLVNQGQWTLTPDRNFVHFQGRLGGNERLKLIADYDGQTIAFPVTLELQTREPRGTRLLSYYRAEVMLRFSTEAR